MVLYPDAYYGRIAANNELVRKDTEDQINFLTERLLECNDQVILDAWNSLGLARLNLDSTELCDQYLEPFYRDKYKGYKSYRMNHATAKDPLDYCIHDKWDPKTGRVRAYMYTASTVGYKLSLALDQQGFDYTTPYEEAIKTAERVN